LWSTGPHLLGAWSAGRLLIWSLLLLSLLLNNTLDIKWCFWLSELWHLLSKKILVRLVNSVTNHSEWGVSCQSLALAKLRELHGNGCGHSARSQVVCNIADDVLEVGIGKRCVIKVSLGDAKLVEHESFELGHLNSLSLLKILGFGQLIFSSQAPQINNLADSVR
jgi:hypothetical protein